MILSFLSVCAFLIGCATGSSGDHDWHFHNCLYEECIPKCRPDEIPYARQLLQWKCEDECKYICMHEINKVKTKLYNLPVEKYYGHWPYVRVWNIQEPAATFFSLLNILPHLFFLLFQLPDVRRKHSADEEAAVVADDSIAVKYERVKRSEAGRMVMWLAWFPYISINAWVMSAAYHARKVPFTTQLDLVSALLLVSYATWCALRTLLSRIFLNARCRELDAEQKKEKAPSFSIARYINDWTVGGAFAVFAAFIGQRIVCMVAYNSVSFGNHMYLCIALSVIHTVLWAVWIILGMFSPTAAAPGDYFTDRSEKSRGAAAAGGLRALLDRKYLCIVCQVYFSVAAISLEVFDFPPVFVHFDAHACWHASTVPLGFLWYVFWLGEV